MSGRPFHSAVVDGVEVVGVMFDSSSGAFYEFADPDTHDRRELYRDPRSGEEIAYDAEIQRMMADVLNGRPRALVPADEWADFREMYCGADQPDYDAWADHWRRMAAADPRFEGGVGDAPASAGNA